MRLANLVALIMTLTGCALPAAAQERTHESVDFEWSRVRRLAPGTELIVTIKRKKGRGLWGHLGPLGGWLVGAMSGGYGAGFACRAASGRGGCDTGAFLTGALLGGIAGGAYGFRAANRETEVIVYRAP